MDQFVIQKEIKYRSRVESFYLEGIIQNARKGKTPSWFFHGDVISRLFSMN